MVRKKFSESSVLFIILGSLILLGFVAYIQDPLLVYFNPENYEDEQSYREYTEVLEGDEDFGGDDIGGGDDDMNGGEVDDSYGGEDDFCEITEDIVAPNNLYLSNINKFYFISECSKDNSDSINSDSIFSGFAILNRDKLKPAPSLEKIDEKCPVNNFAYFCRGKKGQKTKKGKQFPSKHFDCDDFAYLFHVCLYINGWNGFQASVPSHVMNIVQIKSDEKKKNKFCFVEPQHNIAGQKNCCAYTEKEEPTVDMFPEGCGQPIKSISSDLKHSPNAGEACFYLNEQKKNQVLNQICKKQDGTFSEELCNKFNLCFEKFEKAHKK